MQVLFAKPAFYTKSPDVHILFMKYFPKFCRPQSKEPRRQAWIRAKRTVSEYSPHKWELLLFGGESGISPPGINFEPHSVKQQQPP